MTNATRTRADVLAQLRDMRDSAGTDQPYMSELLFLELRDEYRALLEADSVHDWQCYDENVISHEAWAQRLHQRMDEQDEIERIGAQVRTYVIDREFSM